MANPNGNPQNLTPWQPGQSGNPNGRPKSLKRLFMDALEKVASENRLETMMEKAMEQAENGNFRARDFIADYAAGRPTRFEDDNDDRAAFILSLLQPKPKEVEANDVVLLDDNTDG